MLEDLSVHKDLAALYQAQDEADREVPCINDPDLFFPDRLDGGSPSDWSMMRRACASCPIVRQCAEYAIVHEPDFGFWGGMSVAERRQIRRLREKTV